VNELPKALSIFGLALVPICCLGVPLVLAAGLSVTALSLIGGVTVAVIAGATASTKHDPRRDADHDRLRTDDRLIIAAPGLAAFNYSLTGSAIPSVPIRIYGGLLAAYAVLGFAATVLPTRLALCMNPIKAMAARE